MRLCGVRQRPALQRHQVRVRRELVSERLLRFQRAMPDVDDQHLWYRRHELPGVRRRARVQRQRAMRVHCELVLERVLQQRDDLLERTECLGLRNGGRRLHRVRQRAAVQRERLRVRCDVVHQWMLQREHLRRVRESDEAIVRTRGRCVWRLHGYQRMRHDRRQLHAGEHHLHLLDGIRERQPGRHLRGGQ